MGSTEEAKPWPKYHVFLSAEVERTECFHVKKLDAFPTLLACSSTTLFWEDSSLLQKPWLIYKIQIKWHFLAFKWYQDTRSIKVIQQKSSWLLDWYYNALLLETYQLLCLLRHAQELALLFVNRGLGVQGSGSKCNLLHLVSENRKQLDSCYEPPWLHCLDSRVLSAPTTVTGALY